MWSKSVSIAKNEKITTKQSDAITTTPTKICSLGQSVPHLPSCVPVIVGSWTVTRHASPVSGVWSGTTLRRASVQLSEQPHATHSARYVGWPGPAAVADFLNLENWRKETSRRAITTTTTTTPTCQAGLSRVDDIQRVHVRTGFGFMSISSSA